MRSILHLVGAINRVHLCQERTRNGQLRKPDKAENPRRSQADSCNKTCADGIETKLHGSTVVMEEVSSKLKKDFRMRI